MRSKVSQRILDSTPKHVEIYVRMMANLLLRITQIVKDKELSEETLKKEYPETYVTLYQLSEITLRQIARVEAELGKKLIKVKKYKQVKLKTKNKT